MTETLSFPAGHVIFRHTDPSDEAYVIVRGQVEIYKETSDGGEERVAVLKAGQMFGELGVLDDAPRSASARALTNVELSIMTL